MISLAEKRVSGAADHGADTERKDLAEHEDALLGAVFGDEVPTEHLVDGIDLRHWDTPDELSCPMLASPLRDLAHPFCPRVTEHDGHDQRSATFDVLDRDGRWR